MGIKAYKQEDYAKSVAYFDSCLSIHPNDGDIYWFRGMSHLALKKLERAEADLTAFLKFKSMVRDAYLERGRARYLLGKYELAKSDFGTFLELPPGETLQIIYQKSSMESGISGIFTTQSDNLSPAYFHLALCHSRLEEYGQALAMLDSALKYNPDEADFYFEKGNTLAELGQEDLALANYHKALEINPEHFLTKQRMAFLSGSDLDEPVLEKLTMLIAANPENPEGFKQRGYHRLTHDDPGGALEDFTNALRLTGDDPILWYYRGRAHLGLGKYSSAEDDYTKALSLEEEPEFLLARGQARYLMNEYKNALADFTLLISRDPDNPLAYYHKGITLHRISGQGAGCPDLLRAKELGMTEASKAWNKACQSR